MLQVLWRHDQLPQPRQVILRWCGDAGESRQLGVAGPGRREQTSQQPDRLVVEGRRRGGVQGAVHPLVQPFEDFLVRADELDATLVGYCASPVDDHSNQPPLMQALGLMEFLEVIDRAKQPG